MEPKKEIYQKSFPFVQEIGVFTSEITRKTRQEDFKVFIEMMRCQKALIKIELLHNRQEQPN